MCFHALFMLRTRFMRASAVGGFDLHNSCYVDSLEVVCLFSLGKPLYKQTNDGKLLQLDTFIC